MVEGFALNPISERRQRQERAAGDGEDGWRWEQAAGDGEGGRWSTGTHIAINGRVLEHAAMANFFKKILIIFAYCHRSS